MYPQINDSLSEQKKYYIIYTHQLQAVSFKNGENMHLRIRKYGYKNN